MLLCVATVCDWKHMYHYPRSTGRGSSPVTRHHLLLYHGKLTVTRSNLKKTVDGLMSGRYRREQENGSLYVNYVLSFWLTCMAYEEKEEQRAMVNGEFLDQLKAPASYK